MALRNVIIIPRFKFTFMLEESDGYIDLLDWNNLLDKNKNLSDAFVTKGMN